MVHVKKNLKKKTKNSSTWPVLTPTVLGPGPGFLHSLLTPTRPSVQSRVCGGVLLSTDVIQMRAQRQESRSLCWLGSWMLQILLLPPPCPPPPPLPHLIFGSRTARQRCSGSPGGNSGGHPHMTQPMGHRSALVTEAHFPGRVGECRKSVNADPSFSIDLMAPSPLGTGSSWRSPRQ